MQPVGNADVWLGVCLKLTKTSIKDNEFIVSGLFQNYSDDWLIGSLARVSATAVYLRLKEWYLLVSKMQLVHQNREWMSDFCICTQSKHYSQLLKTVNPIEQHTETHLCTSHKTFHQETCIVSMLAWVMKWWNIVSCFNIAENDLNMWEHSGNAHIYHHFHREASKLMTETEKSLMTN